MKPSYSVLTFFHILVIFLSNVNSVLVRNHNCSRYTNLCSDFNIEKFSGEWNLVRLYSPIKSEIPLKCLKIKVLHTGSRVLLHFRVLNDTIVSEPRARNGSAYMHSTMFISDINGDNCDRTWTLFSDKELVPSKWTFLDEDSWGVEDDEDSQSLLYMICSDIRNNYSLVGEFGILSRKPEFPPEILAKYLRTLHHQHNINVDLSMIPHLNCPPITREAVDEDEEEVFPRIWND